MININVFKDNVWQYFLPYVCLLAFLFNLINICVFSSKKLKNPIYNYFLCHSMFECIYAILSFSHFFIKHAIKVPSCSYLVNFVEHYFMNLATTSLAIFLIFIEILISLNRLLVIFYSRCAYKVHFSLQLIALFGALSVLSQYPVYKSRTIRLQSNFSSSSSISCHQNRSYEIYQNYYIRTKSYKIVYSFMTYFRGLLAPLILMVINTIICIKFRKQIRKKSYLRKSQSGKLEIYLVFKEET